MSYLDRARSYLATIDGGEKRAVAHREKSEISEKRGEGVVERMAAEIASFSSEERIAYRRELANPPAADPPSAAEWAALNLAERTRRAAA